MKLEGKVALVTGGGAGIGAAITARFAREGARVCIAGRRKEKLEQTAASLPGGKVTICQGDVTKPEDIKRMVATALDSGGKLDILVNNAGMEAMGRVTECSLEDWQKMLDTNLTGAFLLMKECIPHMIRNGGGSIVNIASLAGKRCLPGGPAYCTSKAALIMLTKQAALDYSSEGVRCNAVCPGATITDMTRRLLTPLAEKLGTDMKGAYGYFTRHSPVRRAADPAEIASLVCFLASDDSSYMTGEDLLVDGGAAIVDVMGTSFREAGL